MMAPDLTAYSPYECIKALCCLHVCGIRPGAGTQEAFVSMQPLGRASKYLDTPVMVSAVGSRGHPCGHQCWLTAGTSELIAHECFAGIYGGTLGTGANSTPAGGSSAAQPPLPSDPPPENQVQSEYERFMAEVQSK